MCFIAVSVIIRTFGRRMNILDQLDSTKPDVRVVCGPEIRVVVNPPDVDGALLCSDSPKLAIVTFLDNTDNRNNPRMTEQEVIRLTDRMMEVLDRMPGLTELSDCVLLDKKHHIYSEDIKMSSSFSDTHNYLMMVSFKPDVHTCYSAMRLLKSIYKLFHSDFDQHRFYYPDIYLYHRYDFNQFNGLQHLCRLTDGWFGCIWRKQFNTIPSVGLLFSMFGIERPDLYNILPECMDRIRSVEDRRLIKNYISNEFT